MNLYSLSAYDYELPNELIAQYPCTPRDSSRLMIVDRKNGQISETVFREVGAYLDPKTRLVFNNTKVIPARLYGKRDSGGAVEIFLTKQLEPDVWLALARPAKKLKKGMRVTFGDSFSCEVVEELPEGERKVRFFHEGDFHQALLAHGEMPLPQYIHRNEVKTLDKERYQTVFAAHEGAVAAPTAGLHFTPELLQSLEIQKTYITLHVGLGTFRPVLTEDIRNHPMHAEHFIISQNAADEINQSSHITCVGTTSCRTLESASLPNGQIVPGEYNTDIFIYPGYQFKKMNALLTNFHLPRSTLLMLVSAFAGRDLILEAYKKAVTDKFRFFSYGDAMLIL